MNLIEHYQPVLQCIKKQSRFSQLGAIIAIFQIKICAAAIASDLKRKRGLAGLPRPKQHHCRLPGQRGHHVFLQESRDHYYRILGITCRIYKA